jgi:tetratricopeptide (TPR) repeat protein
MYMLDANLRAQQKQPDLAMEQYLKCLQASEDLFEMAPQLTFRKRLVTILNMLGSKLHDQGKFQESDAYIHRALEFIVDTDGPVERKKLAFEEVGCNQLLGWNRMHSGDLEGSTKHWDRIIELTRDAPVVWDKQDVRVGAMIYRALSIARTSPAESIREAESLSAVKGLSSLQIYNLSCTSAMASKYLDSGNGREQAEEQALAQLESAVEAGFFRRPKQLESLLANPGFSMLKGNPAFKRIEQTILASSKIQ